MARDLRRRDLALRRPVQPSHRCGQPLKPLTLRHFEITLKLTHYRPQGRGCI